MLINIDNNNVRNEISLYENYRYIRASQAWWRIFEFSIQQRYPAVECLAIHLSDQQLVFFDATNPAAALQQNQSTKLTAYFQKNADDIEACNILYCNFPQFYTWQSTQKCWRRRARINEGSPTAIGSVYSVHPSQGELFYLRLSLHHRVGAMANPYY